MEWTTVYVSSVTNAMRGKKILEQQGLTVYMQRSSQADVTEGCGYRLLVRASAQHVTTILSKFKIRVLRVESGGARG